MPRASVVPWLPDACVHECAPLSFRQGAVAVFALARQPSSQFYRLACELQCLVLSFLPAAVAVVCKDDTDDDDDDDDTTDTSDDGDSIVSAASWDDAAVFCSADDFLAAEPCMTMKACESSGDSVEMWLNAGRVRRPVAIDVQPLVLNDRCYLGNDCVVTDLPSASASDLLDAADAVARRLLRHGVTDSVERCHELRNRLTWTSDWPIVLMFNITGDFNVTGIQLPCRFSRLRCELCLENECSVWMHRKASFGDFVLQRHAMRLHSKRK